MRMATIEEAIEEGLRIEVPGVGQWGIPVASRPSQVKGFPGTEFMVKDFDRKYPGVYDLWFICEMGELFNVGKPCEHEWRIMRNLHTDNMTVESCKKCGAINE